MNVAQIPSSQALGYTRSIQCGATPACIIHLCCPPILPQAHHHTKAAGGEAGEDWAPKAPRSYIVQQCSITLHPSNEIVEQAHSTDWQQPLLCQRAYFYLAPRLALIIQDFPGSTVERSTCQCRSHKFDPWVGSKEKETHPVFLSWKIPWAEKPCEL